MEGQLQRLGIRYRKDDHAFLWVEDVPALQAAADRLTAAAIRQRLDYWTLVVGPKFSNKDRAAISLRRHYSINQMEYCRNFLFRLHQRLRGKLPTVLEKLDPGPHVLRAYGKSSFLRMYEKFAAFLRLEAGSNRVKDFGLNQGLENLQAVRCQVAAVTERFTGFQAQARNVHVDFPLLQRLALPVLCGHTQIAGIKIHHTRMIRLMEVLLHGGTQIAGWPSTPIHQAILTALGLSPETYTLTPLRYDLRKMKAHGLVERDGGHYIYRLSEKGSRVVLRFVLFHKRVCGPLANRLFRPDPNYQPQSKIEAAYHRAGTSIQQLLDLLAA